MALSEQHQEEIDAELQQIQERLSALADELDPQDKTSDRHSFVGQEAKLVAEQVKYLRRSLVIAQQMERLDQLDAGLVEQLKRSASSGLR
jgi:cob(I)alamin adenosyltransferase